MLPFVTFFARIRPAPFKLAGVAYAAVALAAAASVPLLVACALPPPPKTPVPEPVTLIDSLPAAWADEPVVVLAESLSVEFARAWPQDTALTARVTRTEWYYVRSDIPAMLEHLSVDDVEFLESVPLVEAATWRRDPAGDWKRDPEFIRFTRAPYAIEWTFASSHYVQTARVPRYKAGIVLRKREVRNYKRLEFLSGEALRGGLPSYRTVVHLKAPNDARLKSGLLNREGLPVRDTAWVDTAARAWNRRFTASRLPAVAKVPISRPMTWYASVQFSPPVLKGGASPTWTELGDRYLAMAEPFLRRDTAVASLAASLAPPGASALELADSAFAYVRDNLRYHADERSIHAFVPRRLEHIRRQGLGDCKELSALFVALLRERGVEARLALTTSKPASEPSPEYPTLGQFNHVVGAVKDGDTWRFVDATVNFGDAPSSSFQLIGRSALLLLPGESRLVTMGPWPDWKSRVTTRSEVSRQGAGWQIKGRMEVEGEVAHELHPFLRDLKGEERSLYLNGWLRSAFGFDKARATVRSADWRRVELDFQGPYDQGYLAVGKSGLALDEPRVYGNTGQYTSFRIEGPREFEAFEQIDHWVLPAEFSDFDGGAFKRPFATGSWSRDSGGFRREYRQQRFQYFPEDSTALTGFYQERKKFMRKIAWKP